MRNALGLPVALLAALLLADGCSADPDDAVSTTSAPSESTTSTSSTAAPTPTAAPTVTRAPTTSASVEPALAAGDHEFVLDHDGTERLYVVHVPPGLVVEPTAVVVSLHGGGGSATQHQGDAELDAVADREGFVAVYPQGVAALGGPLHTWNAGSFCCGLAARTDVDDVGFIAAVISDVGGRLVFDPDRVVIAGHSNGSMMAMRVAAERPELVAAVVAVAGVNGPDVVPGQPVPMLEIHSVDDPRALYIGGEGPPFPGTTSTVEHFGVEPTLAAWAAANGCDDVVVELAPVVADNGDTATRGEWSGCAEPMIHLRLTGAGHGWPGSPVRWEEIVGPATDVIHASEEIWSFAEDVLSAR